MDRETLSLPIASSQWYTSSLTPIISTPTSDRDSGIVNTAVVLATSPVFELTEEVSY